MESTPKVSIVMPTYNRADLIMETIDSVIGQTYQNWELLIIDEGSTDNTEELITKINDERIKFFRVHSRISVAATRSEGVARANGELIAYIDSDDLWDRFKLEKQIEVLNKYRDAGFCLTGGYNFIKPGEPLSYFYKQREGLKYGKLITAFYKSEMAALSPSLIFHNKCRQEIEFTADVEFIIRLAINFNGIILYEPLLFRRLHDSNISSMNWEERDKQAFLLLKKYKDNVPKKIARDALYRAYLNSGEKHLSYKRNWKAIRRFIGAFSNKPFSIVPFKKIAKACLYLLIK